MAKKKLTASEVDGVQYRRAKTWQIALSQFNNGSAMVFYSLVGLMSYLQNAGYGIAVAAAGIILTATRLLDGLIDPLFALIIDRTRLRHGKLRFFMLLGWFIRSAATLLLFVWGSDKGFGVGFFIGIYVIYIIGSSLNDIAGNMMPPVLTTDPRQRPTVMVWASAYSYLVPTIFAVISMVLILPRHGNQYTVDMLRETALIFIAASFVFQILAVIGISHADKPENFKHLTAEDDVTLGDMWSFLRSNGSFQRYLIASASDKIAQQVGAQAVVNTMLFGILLGNIQIGALMSAAMMLPALVFAIFGARYVGYHGSRHATVQWTWVCLIVASILIVYCILVPMRDILPNLGLAIGFFGLVLVLNGAKMCVTIASGAMRADIVDQELDRSGKYIPGTVTATYNFVDQIVSSFGAAIALGAVALIGFTTVMPQPTDQPNQAILTVTLALYFGLPILGWICTLFAMRGYVLTREEMVNVQRRVADRKAALLGDPEAPAPTDLPEAPDVTGAPVTR